MTLDCFHPACRDWFQSQFGEPTPVQERAWPSIRAGRHTLIAAPTGSGKTLAAFYAAIDDLVRQAERHQLADGVQILYVSPLKALSNDIQRNLETPLDGIAEQLHHLGRAPVDIRVAVRTGDTPATERQRMARRPPHILVTTPESLYLLLTSASGRAMLSSVATVIIDEIHALLGDKRGSHLALSLQRLQHLVQQESGLFVQRIGLSATQKPIDLVARYLVGNAGEDASPDCTVIDMGFQRKLDLRIEVPGSPLSALMSNEVWEELYERLVTLINAHETTLVFVNTRRLSERLALALADRLGESAVCAHHGSMSREHRHRAEQQLKSGALKVLVATASMELGIDIGTVDLVVQFSSPKSIATFLQRVGRSGHSVTGTPKGILFPLTRDDLVEATALLLSVKAGVLDRIIMPDKPLDILAQQIVAEVSSPASGSEDGWDLDSLFELCRGAFPYRDLSRTEFDDLLTMLAEGYSTRRGRRGTLLHLDAINGRVRGRRGANLNALTNGGAIPDMFDYQVVLDPEDVVVGSLNEDFALEALPGDVFTLGTHAWQLLRIDGLSVRVRDAEGMQPTIPFWFGEGPGRTRELSEAVSQLRQSIAELLLDDSANAATQWLCEAANLPRSAAVQLVEYLHTGMFALGVMPTRQTLVMERFFDEVGDMHVVLHAPFGSRLNRAWGLALRKRFCRTFNFELQAAANEDSIVISLGSVHSFVLEEVFRYLNSNTVREVLIQAMLDAPMFEVRWRWNATRSLAIQRNRNGKRVPPQFQRMDAEDLVAQIFPDQIACQENITGKREVPDHPLVNQTIHDCLTEAMDCAELEELIGAIEKDQLQLVAKDLREPSPFAQEIINARPYAFLDDAPFEERRTNAIRHRSWTDPADRRDYSQLDAEAIERVRAEAWPAVSNAEELHDAVFSVAYMTDSEFTRCSLAPWTQQLLATNRVLSVTQDDRQFWIATERAACFKAVYPGLALPANLPTSLLHRDWDESDALREIVRGRLEALGPVQASRIAGEMGLPVSSVDAALTALEVEGFAFQGRFSPAHVTDSRVRPAAALADGTDNGLSSGPAAAGHDAIEWCERRLLQRIHRYTLDSHRRQVQPVSLQTYCAFLFHRHQLNPVSVGAGSQIEHESASLNGQTRLQAAVQMLDGIAAPAACWEADLYAARIPDYDPSWLDALCISGRVCWGRYGVPASSRNRELPRVSGPVRNTPILLALRQNLDIWQKLAATRREDQVAPQISATAARIETDLRAHGASFYDQIQSRTGLLRSQLEQGLAELVSLGWISSDSFTGLRALLATNSRQSNGEFRRVRKGLFGLEDAGRWSLLNRDLRGAEPQLNNSDAVCEQLDEEQLRRLVGVYLQRWGVVFRAVIDKEALAPPWRILLACLRRLELQGIVRGGRFINGVSGEQFAYAETVEALRKVRLEKVERVDDYYCLSACDPLNLTHLLEPTRKLARLTRNRVLYRGGVPVATLDCNAVHFLRECSDVEQARLTNMLLSRPRFPLALVDVQTH